MLRVLSATVVLVALAMPVRGDLCDAIAGIDCSGNDIAKKATRVNSSVECCAFCQSLEGCRAWTWGRDGSCLAKKGCEGGKKDSGAMSGYVVAPPVPPPSDRCTVGLTFHGLNGTMLDNDYIGHDGEMDLDRDWNTKPAKQNYFKGPGHMFSPSSDLNLHYGCNHPGAVCHDEDWGKAEGKWVFVSSPGGPFTTDFDVKLVAVCIDGCPEDTKAGPWWLQGQEYKTVWKFTGQVGRADIVAATVGCCKRKPQTCDALHADPTACHAHCKTHEGPLGAMSPFCIADPCCQFNPSNPDFPIGSCGCNSNPPPTQCDHSVKDVVI